MKFGIYTLLTAASIRPEVLARAAEERGFDSLFIAEHSHIPVRRETLWQGRAELPDAYYRTLAPFPALAAASAVTSTLLLGTAVALLAQRDPIHTAKEVATLDVLSGGRVILGVGSGWNREEMRNHGTDPRTRGALLNERLAAIKAMWTQDEAEFHGEHVDFDPIHLWPKPERRPHPPIYVGGESDAALDRIARFGDGWLPRAATTPEEIRRFSARLAERGRPDVPITLAGLGPDAEAVAGLAEAGVERIAFEHPTTSESESLRALDELAAFADRLR
ncbi:MULTISPECIES: LLM class F420-dependent oxidoreductase [Actinomadura]|uniref:TIGR03619 family F420-dependent LLM class oxidoreductase n=1 Tax=Actinomadura litoris TaxID=2678616 RepID=A0A7K1KSW2_9ACTN|nr:MULTISPECIES: LLM class F420-dependent oxidoreductase [Actinomadura]MBT2207913.1 LLM class F420-dependent oxidoreductase [Actinomadura sp. NEAU-AAG7]MUN35243.1 TIGR03619 family F420-dependent LLM class oxidoreductase [Actinomadura litoris]